MAVSLESLLLEDGVQLHGSGSNRSAKCPFHEDTSPSLSVNVDDGVYFCHGCGAKGNARDYLVARRGMSEPEAAEYVKGDGAPKRRRKKPPAPPRVYPKLPADREAAHRYTDADGTTLCVVVRNKKGATRRDGTPVAKCSQWTPAKGGDGWSPVALKGRLPLYRLPQLRAAPMNRQVMIVEGEKCVKAVERGFEGKALATTWLSGTKMAIHHMDRIDWTPLFGRRILLLADDDATGREAMQVIGKFLAQHCPAVRIVVAQPEGDTTDDIANWVKAGGRELAVAKIREFVRDFPRPEKPQKAAKEKEPPPPPVKTDGLIDNSQFRLLGWVRDHIATMLLSTYQVRLFSPMSLGQPMSLITLADYHWWLALTGRDSMSAGVCQQLGSVLIRHANRIGVVDPAQFLGRGAFKHSGKVGFHLGNRLLYDGKTLGLGDLKGLTPIAGPAIALSEDVAGVDERRRVADAVMRYRWLRENDCRRFLGWIVTAVVGGALDWRPHVWLSAPAQTGKSWLLKTVLKPLLEPMLIRVSDPTVAGLARRAGSDSVGIAFDEAEATRPQIEAVLDLARVAAGGEGERVRADGMSSSTASVLHPRFSLMLSSVTVARMNAANSSRFALIRLSTAGVSDWPAVLEAITAAVARPERLFAAIVRDTAAIVARADDFNSMLIASGVDSRRAAIEAALAAGWEWWSGVEERLMEDTEDEEQTSEAVDLLRYLLGLRIREGVEDMSIGRLLQDGDRKGNARDYGFKVERNNLLIAGGHPSLVGLIARGAWSGVDLQRTILQIDGVTKTPNPRSFGATKFRAIVIPREICSALGIEVFEPPPAPVERLPSL